MLASQCLSWTSVIPSKFSRTPLRYRVLIVSLPKTFHSPKSSSREIQTSCSIDHSSNGLVFGGTGQVRRLGARTLKHRGARFSVGSRRRANLGELADQFGASRFIDLDDPRTFDEALENITGIFLITGYTVDMLAQSKTLIYAPKRNGVKR